MHLNALPTILNLSFFSYIFFTLFSTMHNDTKYPVLEVSSSHEFMMLSSSIIPLYLTQSVKKENECTLPI